MGLFSRKRTPERPMLYQGRLIEVQLRPKEGWYAERNAALGDRGRRNLWCLLATRTVSAGKVAGTTEVEVSVRLDDGSSVLVGRIVQEQMERDPTLLGALNTGINGATVYLNRDGRDGEITATLRLGPHQYMPRPLWD